MKHRNEKTIFFVATDDVNHIAARRSSAKSTSHSFFSVETTNVRIKTWQLNTFIPKKHISSCLVDKGGINTSWVFYGSCHQ